MSKPGKHYEFGAYSLDLVQRILLHDGQHLPLTPKAYEILLALLENSGHIISKEELMQRVWPDAFVEEINLAKNISLLRKTLSNGANGREFIETLPKRGYRFIAPVNLVEQAAEQPHSAELGTAEPAAALLPGTIPERQEISLPAAATSSRWKALLLAGLLLVLAGASFLWLWRERSSVEPIKTLAVLPFKFLGADKEDEHLGLGLTDALITGLASFKQLTVRPTSAVLKFQPEGQEAVAAGRALQVEAVLTGYVQKFGATISVRLQLIRVANGALLWSGESVRPAAALLQLQDSVTAQIAQALALRMTDEQLQQQAHRRYRDNAEAYQAYLKGRYFWNKRSAAGMKKSLAYFQQALSIDPHYALAYAALADARITLGEYRELPAQEAYPQAKAAAVQALALDDTLAEAHTSLAMIQASYDWDWRAAEASFRRALELNPNYPTAHQWYAEYLAGRGRRAESLAQIRQAQQLDPTSLVFQSAEAWVLYFAHDYDGMIAQCRRVLEMDARFSDVYVYLARAYEQQGKYRAALDAFQQWAELTGYNDPQSEALRRAPVSGYADYWRRRVALERLAKEQPPFNLAETLAQLAAEPAARTEAFALLEVCLNRRDYHLMYLQAHPNFARLHTDARFADLLRRTGLPEEKK